MNYSLPGSSVHGILQARILEWVAISSSGGPSWPRDWTQVSCISCMAGGFLTATPWGLPYENFVGHITPILYSCSFSCETSFPECLGERVGLQYSFWFPVLELFQFFSSRSFWELPLGNSCPNWYLLVSGPLIPALARRDFPSGNFSSAKAFVQEGEIIVFRVLRGIFFSTDFLCLLAIRKCPNSSQDWLLSSVDCDMCCLVHFCWQFWGPLFSGVCNAGGLLPRRCWDHKGLLALSGHSHPYILGFVVICLLYRVVMGVVCVSFASRF